MVRVDGQPDGKSFPEVIARKQRRGFVEVDPEFGIRIEDLGLKAAEGVMRDGHLKGDESRVLRCRVGFDRSSRGSEAS